MYIYTHEDLYIYIYIHIYVYIMHCSFPKPAALHVGGRQACLLVCPSQTADVSVAWPPQSKATPLGAVVKFAAGGKQRGKKDLAMLAVETYGQDVYVASVCLEANYAQVMKAFAEAEAHKGVSLIVAYAPCVMQVGGSPFLGGGRVC